MMVNILLPSYDITQGEQYYDEILAAQFCISLSQCLQDLLALSSCTILLRNGKAERFARRVLMTTSDESKTPDIHQEDNNNDTDFDGIGDTVDETERFRQQLLRLEASTAWKGDDNVETYNNDNIKPQTSTEAAAEQEQERDHNDKGKLEANGTRKRAYVQLSSLLGDEAISKGTDMADDVIQAVTDRFRESASHASKDEAIIILSSFSPEDMVAVRRVMQLYEGSDTLFVLVNCKLNPIPRELLRSEVVYSLLPLTVRERASQSTLMNKRQQNQENDYDNTIKVIVLRRYPQGWEIFIDRNGSGFTLASTVNVNPMERNGPTMDRIAALVEHYLKQTSRGGRTLKQQDEEEYDDDDDNILQ